MFKPMPRRPRAVLFPHPFVKVLLFTSPPMRWGARGGEITPARWEGVLGRGSSPLFLTISIFKNNADQTTDDPKWIPDPPTHSPKQKRNNVSSQRVLLFRFC